MAVKIRREQQHNNENIPPEIWLEIHSRLPVKDVFKYHCVAKPWNPIPLSIYRKIIKQPVCGLILRDTTYLVDPGDCGITYLSKGAIESVSIRTEISINNPLAVSSGFDTGYLRDTFFEFGPLSSLPQGEFFTVDNGLILTGHSDGTYHVYNPLTKQVLHLPMSPLVESACIINEQENCAFLHSPCPFPYYACLIFLVFRIIPRARAAEVFISDVCKWFVFELVTNVDDDGEVLNSSWCSENFVYVRKTQTLFFLTEKDQGLAVEFDDSDKVEGYLRRKACVYNIPLPEVVKGGFIKARLGGNRECLYLSYYDDDGGVWFWKRNSERLTYNDTWVLVLEIGKTPKLSRSLEHNHNPLFELLKEGNSIIPIGFYPRVAKALLRVNYTIFTYDLIKKELAKFAEISDKDFKLSTMVLPYVPLVAPFRVSTKSGKLKPMTVAAHLDMMIDELPC